MRDGTSSTAKAPVAEGQMWIVTLENQPFPAFLGMPPFANMGKIYYAETRTVKIFSDSAKVVGDGI
jgi:hypothetical protein